MTHHHPGGRLYPPLVDRMVFALTQQSALHFQRILSLDLYIFTFHAIIAAGGSTHER
jgi:hypothetical protein